MISFKSEIKIKNKGKIILKRGQFFRSNVTFLADSGCITVGENTFANKGCFVTSLDSIVIGRNCSLGPNVMIFDHDHNYKRNNTSEPEFLLSPVFIGDNVWIGANAVILRGTKIGNNCVIGAGTVIKGTVPDNTVVYQKNELIFKQR